MADTYQPFAITSESALLRNFGVYLSNCTQAHPRVQKYSVTIMNEEHNPYQLTLILTLIPWGKKKTSWKANSSYTVYEFPPVNKRESLTKKNVTAPHPQPEEGGPHPEGKITPTQTWIDPEGSRRLTLPDFLHYRHMKVVRLSALGTDRLYAPGEIPGTQ